MAIMNFPGLFKPEYFYQPHRLLNRLLTPQRKAHPGLTEEKLPWGLSIQVHGMEEHGQILAVLGVVDLAVTEVLWRLADRGEMVVDVGANIGYMTAALAAKIGQGGQVWAFEAHPEIFKELQWNVDRWQQILPQTAFHLQQVAVSDQTGTLTLGIPQDFDRNRGLAFVINSGKQSSVIASPAISQVQVPSTMLDDCLPTSPGIGVLKLDVEGHELNVLRGAKHLLHNRRIRDCVFEQHDPYPSAVTDELEAAGYQVFRIHRQFWRPSLLPPDSPIQPVKWLPTSFLATLDPDRALDRCQRLGWQIFQKFL